VLDLAFRPDPEAPEPLYRQLGGYVRGLIEAGRLLPGQKLPATRELARSLGLGRNTVNLAYEGLAESGWVTAHVGQGTFVSSPRAAAVSGDGSSEGGRGFVWESLFSKRGHLRLLPRTTPGRQREVRFDLRAGRVELGALPLDVLRRAASRAVRELPAVANRIEPGGSGALRGEVARSLVARGISCEADDVLIVHGAQQALDLVARTLLDPGDTVVVEQPGYFGAPLAFAGSQATLVGVGVDAEGLRVEELRRILRARRVKLIYTTPAVQCPSGVVMSAGRRAELLELADATQTPVLEDDYDCQLRLGSKTPLALKAMDAAGQVIYVGTFSKALFPGLRLGYVVAAPALRERLQLGQLASDFGCSKLDELLLLDLLRTGALQRHVRRMRRVYRERLDALVTALGEGLPEDVVVTRPAGGTALWLTLPGTVDAAIVHERAEEAGIAYTRGHEFFIDERGSQHLYLSFACHEPSELVLAARELTRIVHGAWRGPGRAGSRGGK
jgi:GntR family transcriptional regulator/MocR family aminotransferase